MKISFFIGAMGHGGAERVISILANDYCARGWDVDIVLLLKNEIEHDLDQRIKIVNLTGKNSNYFKNAIFWLRGIRHYLKSNRPDRIVSFIGRINALVLTASVGLGLPIVVSERNDPKNDGRGAMMQWYCNRIYHKAKAIVYQTAHEKSCFDPSLADKGYIIPNPVRVSAQRETDTEMIVVTAGRLAEQKNQAMLLRAMARVRERDPQIKCRIYGDGALAETLQQQINELELEDAVSLEGNVSDIHQRLAQCAIFVLTSKFEGLSNALIEAMMVGLPCITTDYPGARELIIHGQNGIVVPMDDDETLALQIEKLARDSQYAQTLSRQGQQDAQRYKTDVVLQQWYTVIEG